jgi:hypothetical protein
MMAARLEVPLEDIPTCFEGIIPSPICTLAEDGTPNITFLSVVHRVDENHVALSRQFFKKTDENTLANPYAQITVFEPDTGRIFALDLVYERTDTEGPLFERMRTNLDAVAANEGMTNVFKLKGTDICLVERCWMLPGKADAEDVPRQDVNIERVQLLSSRLANIDDMDGLLAEMLKGCAELLGYPHAFVMLLDETGKRLYTVDSIGFPASGAGSEANRQTVRVTHMSRERSYTHAVRESAVLDTTPLEQVIPLPHLPAVESQLVTPMLAYHDLVGVLCLQSEKTGAFRAADECIAAILANQVAVAMATLPKEEAEESEPTAEPEAACIEVKHYAEDDSVFLDNEYLIKGVAGGILWRLLKNHEEQGRTEFSNREIRLDQTLDLPDIKDNLEARLILLRKRLDERCDSLRIEKTSRGRFRLNVTRPLRLVHVEGDGPL